MKPEKILLIRHGQSIGNVDKQVYAKTPDYALELTAKGKMQAAERGVDIKRLIGVKPIFFYVSPFRRTRETFEGIASAFDPNQITYREDPRLREQEWAGKMNQQGFDEDSERERATFGHFYYRFQSGESCADVYDRMGGFLDSLFRDFEKPEFPSVCAIVSHGMAIRVLLMRWFHMTVEEFELLKNPRNAAMITLNRQSNGKYALAAPLEKHDKPDHPYQFPIQL